MEFSHANETNVADFYWRKERPRVWFPQCVAVGRVLDRKPLAENVVVGHGGVESSMTEGRMWEGKLEDWAQNILIVTSKL